ncbi:PREDICTED: uncharacterized protein LOC104610092 [Nelumbo nucifera]|uniref:DUF4228 domain-containing protein n=2 Tax=Nelumbo nucifera TaxID=4432 RepID=A0A822XHL0_NELNU|nr:PREDICTED: uncharacterized protein LOC104610092 [Nelumbo nucifera]DAD19870.1 TPA_asm: hypothetical protein HUJ06_021333 [Nelumbo nucifera]
MGNYNSCTLASPPGRQSRGAKVILPSGEIRQLDGQVKAAELMFETPNYFLVNSRSLQIGRRFSALNADKDLEMGNVYIMFPMKRVNSVITAADMGVLFMSANSAAKRASDGKVRILPEAISGNSWVTPVSAVNNSSSSEAPLPRLDLGDIEKFSTPEFRRRLSVCRSKKPLLETITEEPICSR